MFHHTLNSIRHLSQVAALAAISTLLPAAAFPSTPAAMSAGEVVRAAPTAEQPVSTWNLELPTPGILVLEARGVLDHKSVPWVDATVGGRSLAAAPAGGAAELIQARTHRRVVSISRPMRVAVQAGWTQPESAFGTIEVSARLIETFADIQSFAADSGSGEGGEGEEEEGEGTSESNNEVSPAHAGPSNRRPGESSCRLPTGPHGKAIVSRVGEDATVERWEFRLDSPSFLHWAAAADAPAQCRLFDSGGRFLGRLELGSGQVEGSELLLPSGDYSIDVAVPPGSVVSYSLRLSHSQAD